MLGLTWLADPAAAVRETAAMTSNPFGANFVVSWDQRAPIEDALEAGLRIVSLSFGDPAGYVDQVHHAGGLVLHSVGSAEEARRAVAAGADVVVARAGRQAAMSGARSPRCRSCRLSSTRSRPSRFSLRAGSPTRVGSRPSSPWARKRRGDAFPARRRGAAARGVPSSHRGGRDGRRVVRRPRLTHLEPQPAQRDARPREGAKPQSSVVPSWSKPFQRAARRTSRTTSR